MNTNKMAIVHFQPVEKYPPVMNLIRTIAQDSRITLEVYTTSDSNNKWIFQSYPAIIKKLARQASGSFSRYINYVFFNAAGFLSLLLFRPRSIMYYETYSVFPVWLYMKCFPATKLIIHYHEYSSPAELLKYSGYLRFLGTLENALWKKASWISHTNAKRLSMFQKEHDELRAEQLRVLSNYPPKSWYEGITRRASRPQVRKMVYAGALSLHTMYTEALCRWIVAQNGLYTLDIYSDNYTAEAANYLHELDSPLIKLRKAVSYYDLPQVLNQYEIGLVIYNGHIPNYVYNVPNKVFEYYACGLEIWCSKDMLSVIEFKQQEQIRSLRIIDFHDLDSSLRYPESLALVVDENRLKIFSAEAEYSGLLQSI